MTSKRDVTQVEERVGEVDEDLGETKVKVEEIDNKTMTNAPAWSRDLTKIMNPKEDHVWRLLVQSLGYSPDDIRHWATQSDPCMALLNEWYVAHKTSEATHAILKVLIEMDRMDGAAIVENAIKSVEGVVDDEPPEYETPPPIFLSYQWGHQNEAKMLRKHLQMAGYECWMASDRWEAAINCLRKLMREYKPLKWFFQRGKNGTKDDRFWETAKFQELLLQLNLFGVMPDGNKVNEVYKDWWTPVTEGIVVNKNRNRTSAAVPEINKIEDKKETEGPPLSVFISYQWGKQKQIIALYNHLTGLGYHCWMDIHQMGGGDSLYDKIDRRVWECEVVLSCVTQKYALSANCHRELRLADALKKPIVPLFISQKMIQQEDSKKAGKGSAGSTSEALKTDPKQQVAAISTAKVESKKIAETTTVDNGGIKVPDKPMNGSESTSKTVEQHHDSKNVQMKESVGATSKPLKSDPKQFIVATSVTETKLSQSCSITNEFVSNLSKSDLPGIPPYYAQTAIPTGEISRSKSCVIV
ncbi:hypothetical protein ScPMuIL_018447 [Solemya velum]